MPLLLLASALVSVLLTSAQPPRPAPDGRVAPHRCAADARAHASRLLALHRGPDDRLAIDSAVRVLPSVRNPAGGALDVLEVLQVHGFIYRARYRMRFLYAPLRGECVLMGQEILELARA